MNSFALHPLRSVGVLVFDQIEIDLRGHRLFVDRFEISLERKAFAVLALLASEPGRVFTRDEILDAVWSHRHVTPSVLNRIITLLRQALGEHGRRQRYLQTVHGVGYRFDAYVHRESGHASVEAFGLRNGWQQTMHLVTYPHTSGVSETIVPMPRRN